MASSSARTDGLMAPFMTQDMQLETGKELIPFVR